MALLALATAAGADVIAVHVDHGIRPGSESEASVVARAAERFGAAFRSERVDVAAGPNLEARARAARHAVLGPDAMTGHTADDQAETMVINLLRGGALNGLSGMRPDRHPLLGLRRSETHELCRTLAIDVVDDPSNRLPIHLRNRVRAELMPLLVRRVCGATMPSCSTRSPPSSIRPTPGRSRQRRSRSPAGRFARGSPSTIRRIWRRSNGCSTSPAATPVPARRTTVDESAVTTSASRSNHIPSASLPARCVAAFSR
jgi:tRNA(Ile)-lysidine synthetase-like protein